VLLVHGIWDTGRNFRHLIQRLERAGHPAVHTVELRPNTGSAPLSALAEQVDAAASALLAKEGTTQLDLVGFSMGALVARYWLQRLGGNARTRRFVSISGPHQGTWTAWFMPLAGVRQMRPSSALLRDLARDERPFADVEVHVLWTPFDLMVFPPRTACIPGAKSEHRVTTLLHRFMLTNGTALDRVVEILNG
jgi:triacylglycerol lipase